MRSSNRKREVDYFSNFFLTMSKENLQTMNLTRFIRFIINIHIERKNAKIKILEVGVFTHLE